MSRRFSVGATRRVAHGGCAPTPARPVGGAGDAPAPAAVSGDKVRHPCQGCGHTVKKRAYSSSVYQRLGGGAASPGGDNPCISRLTTKPAGLLSPAWRRA